jgi:hypothetical protein
MVTTTSSTAAGACMDDVSNVQPGFLYPSDCPCAPEAEANLPLIAQAAIDHFQSTGVLCGSSVFVPASVPPGKGYHVDSSDGGDFQTGDGTFGWKCLGFALSGGIHCRFTFQQGKGPGFAAGGPDPGPGGFEVSAQGDDDGDGIFSTFSIAGTLDPQTGSFTASPLFQHDPAE